MTKAVVLFLDGVGLGVDDAAINPLAAAEMPMLTRLLAGKKLLAGNGRIEAPLASMTPTDARLGVSGRPQSATGQTALLTGLNAPAILGEHYGPRPNLRLREILQRETLFTKLLAAGRSVCFANAYPAGYFAAVERGKRLHGAIPQAVVAAGLALRTADDLAAGRALSVDLSNAAWRNGMGYPEMPLRTPVEAGRIAAQLSGRHDLVFFDQWASDMLGHRGDLAGAIGLFQDLDRFLGGLLAEIDLEETLVAIISDHGNVEDCADRRHTENPVPTILIGAGHDRLSRSIAGLTDIMPALLEALS